MRQPLWQLSLSTPSRFPTGLLFGTEKYDGITWFQYIELACAVEVNSRFSWFFRLSRPRHAGHSQATKSTEEPYRSPEVTGIAPLILLSGPGATSAQAGKSVQGTTKRNSCKLFRGILPSLCQPLLQILHQFLVRLIHVKTVAVITRQPSRYHLASLVRVADHVTVKAD